MSGPTLEFFLAVSKALKEQYGDRLLTPEANPALDNFRTALASAEAWFEQLPAVPAKQNKAGFIT